MSAPDIAERLSPAKQELLRRLRSDATGAAGGGSGPIPLRPGDGSPALVLVHPVGGALFCYAALTAALRTASPVYGFADAPEPDPGPPAHRVKRLASRYVAELREAGVPRPWVLGGWSFGGVVAYEMARQDGETGRVLLVDAAYVWEEEATPLPDAEIRRWFARDIARLAGVPDDRVELGSDDAEVGELVARTGAETGLGRDELLERYAIFEANSRALLGYRPEPYDGAVTLVLAERSPDVSDVWARYVSGPIDSTVVPGDHYDLLTPASAKRLGRIVDDLLREEAST